MTLAGREGARGVALQAAWSADAEQATHEQCEIEATNVDQYALADVRVAAEMHAAHPTGLIEMGKAPFQTLPAESQPAKPASTTNAPTVTVHCVAGRRVLLPLPPAPIGFGDVVTTEKSIWPMLRTDSMVLITRVDTAGDAPRYVGDGAVGQRRHPSSSLLLRQLTGLP
jgi:hypothetical protein